MEQPDPAAEHALPRAARQLAAIVLAVALALAMGVVALAGFDVDVLTIAVLAAAIAVGEAIGIDLPFRRGGVAAFSLCDTALVVGLLLATGPEVVIAGAIAMAGLQLAERLDPFKQMFNLGQTVAGFAAAALILELLAPRPGPLSIEVVGAAALGVLALLIVNAAAIAGMISIHSGEGWISVVRRLLPVGALLMAGNFCLGLLVVLLLESPDAWALPALAVPIVLLHRASRAEVRAQLGRERAQSLVTTEQRLAEALDTDAVARILAAGATELLGVAAAVWHARVWATPVPVGSGPCPIDPTLSTALEARGPGLGPAVSGGCAAIGLDAGVLVIWDRDLRVDDDAREWFERLARSGRVHFARAAAASALAKEQATMRAVVDGTADGICVLDATGAVRVWNPAMANLAGVTAEDALGRPASLVLGEGPWRTDGIQDVMRAGDGVWRVAVSSVADRAHGALQVAVVHDVSAERRVARMKDDMLAVVSHELRTPLTPIKGSAQLLLRRWERMAEAQRESLLGQVLSSADHLNRLVDDLLLVAQLSTAANPAPKIALTPIDLCVVVEEGADALQVGHPDHVISVDCPEQLTGLSDPLRLRQIVDNLVVNACKFSDPGTTVSVTLRRDGNEAVLAIQDQGRGIAAGDLERIFERFERVEDPLVMTTSGAGLGLYIVRALIHALGGTITLDSTLDVGTTATVRLPLLNVAEHTDTQHSPAIRG